jgi:hypothetical protein
MLLMVSMLRPGMGVFQALSLRQGSSRDLLGMQQQPAVRLARVADTVGTSCSFLGTMHCALPRQPVQLFVTSLR